MPKPDPIPSPRRSEIRRIWRLFRWLALFAAIVALIAVLLVARGDTQTHWHMLVATAAGTWLTVFVGGSLMILMFVSASSGHDQVAAKTPNREDDKT